METIGKIYHCSWIGRLNIVKMLILLKLIYSCNTIPIKFLGRVIIFFVNMGQIILKFIWDSIGTVILKQFWKIQVGTITLLYLKTYMATVIKTVVLV